MGILAYNNLKDPSVGNMRFLMNNKKKQNYNTECFKTTIAGFDIRLLQSRQRGRRFTVTYGAEVTESLTYSDAAAILGGSIIHALALDDKVNTQGD